MKDDNKMYTKPQYKCGVCGKIYDSIQERMKCEMACIKKQQDEEKAAIAAKKKEEKDNRYNEVNAALDNAYALINKYIEDYGSFKYGGNYKGLDILNMDFFPSKLLHHLFF